MIKLKFVKIRMNMFYTIIFTVLYRHSLLIIMFIYLNNERIIQLIKENNESIAKDSKHP